MNGMIDVAAAVMVDDKNRIFIARKKKGLPLEGLWEFPGGKIEKGESAAEAVERELLEEMNIEIEAGGLVGESVYAYEEFTVRLIAHYAKITGGEIRLTDHDRYEWVTLDEMSSFSLAPADEPLKKLIEKRNGSVK